MGTEQVSVAWALGGVSFQTEEGWESQAPLSSAMVWAWHGRGSWTELEVTHVGSF